MNSPLVSVVIPVYNVEHFIKTCLDSVLAQSYENLEVLVVDDGSPDQSIPIVEQYNDQRLRIIRQENRGLASARNTGIREARGDFIALLDSDDFWSADKIQKHVAVMLANPKCGLSFSASMFVDENGKSLNRLQEPYNKEDFNSPQIFCRNPIGNGSVPMIARSVFDQIAYKSAGVQHLQYFDESLRQSEDIDCWTRITLQTETEFHYIDKPLTFYRLNSGGLSANVDRQFEAWERVLAKVTYLAPEFAKKYGRIAKAYQYRYLARRLILEANTFKACRFIGKALITSPMIIIKEPKRTLTTLVASLGLSLLPISARRKIVSYIL
ncbi:MAG: glycosyltransferase involved in cell wall biosynthesis [Arenicella sp.]|jgi:glycosyltransferase involved in cell wall biosynthesis